MITAKLKLVPATPVRSKSDEKTYVMVEGLWYPKPFVESLTAQLNTRAPLLLPGRDYTLREVCGDGYWAREINGAGTVAGKCAIGLCKMGRVRLIDTNKRNSANHRLYRAM